MLRNVIIVIREIRSSTSMTGQRGGLLEPSQRILTVSELPHAHFGGAPREVCAEEHPGRRPPPPPGCAAAR